MAVSPSVIYKPADIRVLMDDIDIEGLCIIPHPLSCLCCQPLLYLNFRVVCLLLTMKIDEQIPRNREAVKQNLSVLNQRQPPAEKWIIFILKTISQVNDKVELISMTDRPTTIIIKFQYLGVG